MRWMNKQAAQTKLRALIAQADSMKRVGSDSPEFVRWKRDVEVALGYIFGDKSRHVEDFKDISYHPGAWSSSTPDSYFAQVFRSGVDDAVSILESMIDEIGEYWADEVPGSASIERDDDDRMAAPARTIFVIHGHDHGFKETVARFLELLELQPIILHEQANEGRTIIEKFEDHAGVPFAIALFTPDDVGRNVRTAELQPRARQNVVFEFGFFVGKLGRNKAAALVKGDVELPSDYDGVIYISVDESQRWRLDLVRELKAANIDVDANKAV
jgi:Predicted nucleotide-binding protein containing TIR-like domain